MPGQRSPGQALIGTWCDEDFVDEIDRVRKSTRSQFCRDALVEKLASMGVDTKSLLTRPPDRAGKGNRRRSINTKPYVMNDKTNSGALLRAKKTAAGALKKAIREAR